MGEEPEHIGEGTGGSGVNVLMIGTDSTLAMDKDKVIGDSQERHILYGNYLSRLFIVVLSKKEQKLTVKGLSDNVTVYPTSSRRFLFVWDAYRIGKRLCRENKIDVITTQDPLLTGLIGYLLKRKYDIPLNVQLHGDYLNNRFWLEESKLNYLFNITGNFIIKRADSIRVVSDSIREKLVKQLSIAGEITFVLPVFTDISRFMKDLPRIDLQDRYSRFRNIILFVGALSKTKNVDLLLRAATDVVKKHPDTLFLIAGKGKEEKRLKELVANLGLEQNIKFEGDIPYEDIPSYYHSCDFLVLPSKHEGWGRVVIEALASEKPVITSDACGVSDLVINVECGFVFPVDRPDILAEKITHLLSDRELSRQMGERGRTYVMENLDIKKNAYKYRELYEKTIELAKRGKRI